MKKKANNFLWSYFLIFFLIVLDVFLMSYFKGELFRMDIYIYAFVLSSVGIFELVFIYRLLDRELTSPLRKLEYTIKSFLGGRFKGKNINFGRSSNARVDYILGSLDVMINSLRGVKGELVSGRAIKTEVELTKEIQERLLNKKLLAPPSMDIIARSKPAAEIGGDSYDVIKQEDNYYIYVGDVTGHGVASGFVMVMVNALISGFSKLFKKGNHILAYTNEILKPRVKSNMLMSLLLVRWDEEAKRLFMTGAGHEYLIIYKASQNKCFKIKSGGLALGMTKNVHKLLKEQEIQFEKDDILVLYSDGITEAKINTKKRSEETLMFGEDGLVNAIQTSPDIILNGKKRKTARSVFNNITIALSRFMGYKHTQHDDVTLVVCHYKGDDVINDNLPEPEKIDDAFITEWKW
ncbi:MAG: SpoIIE family protein phosphatase [Candidatus Gracilibacteria bacterium]|nr:SpoIIE family protein phosphatase [Candidatus Gracilibacteria bacterium]